MNPTKKGNRKPTNVSPTPMNEKSIPFLKYSKVHPVERDFICPSQAERLRDRKTPCRSIFFKRCHYFCNWSFMRIQTYKPHEKLADQHPAADSFRVATTF